MNILLDALSALLVLSGLVFYLAGTVGLLRFPDVFTRLHALTKADNLGLGLVIAGLAVHADSWVTVGKLALIWLLVIVASATVCQSVATQALRQGIKPWEAP